MKTVNRQTELRPARPPVRTPSLGYPSLLQSLLNRLNYRESSRATDGNSHGGFRDSKGIVNRESGNREDGIGLNGRIEGGSRRSRGFRRFGKRDGRK